MIFVSILVGVLFIALVGWVWYNDGFVEALLAFFVGGFVAFIFWILCMCGCSLLTTIIDPEVEVASTEATEIYALKDDSYCSRTYVNEELVYIYLYPTAQGQTVGTVKAKYAYIQPLPTGEMPTIVTNITTFKNPLANFFLFPPSNTYTLYLPDGAIIDNYYMVDLE